MPRKMKCSLHQLKKIVWVWILSAFNFASAYRTRNPLRNHDIRATKFCYSAVSRKSVRQAQEELHTVLAMDRACEYIEHQCFAQWHPESVWETAKIVLIQHSRQIENTRDMENAHPLLNGFSTKPGHNLYLRAMLAFRNERGKIR
jgi:hypothetical protein